MKKYLGGISLLLVALLLVGCKKPAPAPTDNEPAPLPEANQEQLEDNSDEDIPTDDEGINIADLWEANNPDNIDSLKVTVTTIDADGNSQGDMSITSDGTLTQMNASSPEGESIIIYNAEATYMKMPQSEQWLKLPAIDQAPIQPVTFQANEIATQWKEGVNYLGKRTCATGMCHAYEGTDEYGTSIVMFDTDSQLLTQVEGSGPDGSKATLQYEYNIPVDISLPDNVVDMGALGGGIDPSQFQ